MTIMKRNIIRLKNNRRSPFTTQLVEDAEKNSTANRIINTINRDSRWEMQNSMVTGATKPLKKFGTLGGDFDCQYIRNQCILTRGGQSGSSSGATFFRK